MELPKVELPKVELVRPSVLDGYSPDRPLEEEYEGVGPNSEEYYIHVQ